MKYIATEKCTLGHKLKPFDTARVYADGRLCATCHQCLKYTCRVEVRDEK
jgi:hypothetical protein